MLHGPQLPRREGRCCAQQHSAQHDPAARGRLPCAQGQSQHRRAEQAIAPARIQRAAERRQKDPRRQQIRAAHTEECCYIRGACRAEAAEPQRDAQRNQHPQQQKGERRAQRRKLPHEARTLVVPRNWAEDAGKQSYHRRARQRKQREVVREQRRRRRAPPQPATLRRQRVDRRQRQQHPGGVHAHIAGVPQHEGMQRQQPRQPPCTRHAQPARQRHKQRQQQQPGCHAGKAQQEFETRSWFQAGGIRARADQGRPALQEEIIQRRIRLLRAEHRDHAGQIAAQNEVHIEELIVPEARRAQTPQRRPPKQEQRQSGGHPPGPGA